PDDYTGGYSGYRGSGFQHLFNVQRATDGPVVGEWTHEKDPNAKLRIHLLAPDVETILADAHVSPVKQHQILKYLIARRSGEPLQSRFVSVAEPFSDTALIRSAQMIELAEGGGVAISVALEDPARSRDIVIVNSGSEKVRIADPAIETDAAFAIIRFSGEEITHRWFTGGTQLTVGSDALQHAPQLTGEVITVDPQDGLIHIHADAAKIDLDSFTGRVVHFENGLRRTAHVIESVEQTDSGLVITVRDDLRVGHVRIAEVLPEGLLTRTGLAFAAVYDGAYVSDSDFSVCVALRSVDDGKLAFVTPVEQDNPFAPGEDAWIVNVGRGDRAEVTGVTSIATSP
ncbi:MAG: hypothetical protein KJ060_19925, partial [Candidatus Hydrogenedentes bacterium]|nr:hypothetical protein [Candidatus Hydrogenedentota bacterium]